MFSSLKFSTLRTRARCKDANGQQNRCEDEDPDVGCGPSLKCQQPFNKCELFYGWYFPLNRILNGVITIAGSIRCLREFLFNFLK